MVAGVKCPKCGSTHIWKVGFVPTRKGHRTRYKCVNCAYTFYQGQARPVTRVAPVAKRARKASKKKVG